jgi:hypothetical protein
MGRLYGHGYPLTALLLVSRLAAPVAGAARSPQHGDAPAAPRPREAQSATMPATVDRADVGRTRLAPDDDERAAALVLLLGSEAARWRLR